MIIKHELTALPQMSSTFQKQPVIKINELIDTYIKYKNANCIKGAEKETATRESSTLRGSTESCLAFLSPHYGGSTGHKNNTLVTLRKKEIIIIIIIILHNIYIYIY